MKNGVENNFFFRSVNKINSIKNYCFKLVINLHWVALPLIHIDPLSTLWLSLIFDHFHRQKKKVISRKHRIPNEYLFAHLQEVKTIFLGDILGSNIGCNEGRKFFSDKYKNLSNNTAVSTSGASKNRNVPKATTSRQRSKHLFTSTVS